MYRAVQPWVLQVLPVEDVVNAARSVGACVLLDACQSVPHMPIDIQRLDVDFLVASVAELMLCDSPCNGMLGCSDTFCNAWGTQRMTAVAPLLPRPKLPSSRLDLRDFDLHHSHVIRPSTSGYAFRAFILEALSP